MQSTHPIKPSRRILWGYLLVLVIFIFSAVLGAAHEEEPIDPRALRVFTPEELAAFDGKEGRPAYYTYEGKIYDVSGSNLWKEGAHPGDHLAGEDLTGKLEGAPHGTEVFEGFEIVGILSGSKLPVSEAQKDTWYPILFFGKTLTAWTGYVFGLIFILNFATCYVMPWCAHCVPWKGKIPGPDKWDEKLMLKLSYYHRYIAWFTVIFGVLHGTLGILESFGIVI